MKKFTWLERIVVFSFAACVAVLCVAAGENRFAILRGFLQSNLDGNGFDATNFNTISATNITVPSTLTINQLTATNINNQSNINTLSLLSTNSFSSRTGLVGKLTVTNDASIGGLAVVSNTTIGGNANIASNLTAANSTISGLSIADTNRAKEGIFTNSVTSSNVLADAVTGTNSVTAGTLTVNSNANITGNASIGGTLTTTGAVLTTPTLLGLTTFSNNIFGGSNIFSGPVLYPWTTISSLSSAGDANNTINIGNAHHVRLAVGSMTGPANLNAIEGVFDGRDALIWNDTGYNVTFKHQSGFNATTSYRLKILPAAGDLTLTNGSIVLVSHESSSDRWLTIPFATTNAILTAAGGSQTPWESDIDAANYLLTKVGGISTTNSEANIGDDVTPFNFGYFDTLKVNNLNTVSGGGAISVGAGFSLNSLQLATGAGLGKIMTSDGSGNASWQTPGFGNYLPVQFATNGSSQIVIRTNAVVHSITNIGPFSIRTNTYDADVPALVVKETDTGSEYLKFIPNSSGLAALLLGYSNRAGAIDFLSYRSIRALNSGNDLAIYTGDDGLENAVQRILITGNMDSGAVVITNAGLVLESGPLVTKAHPPTVNTSTSGCLLTGAFKTTTADATPTVIGQIELTSEGAFIVAEFVGVDTSTGDMATYIRRAQFHNNGGITQQGSTATIGTDFEDASLSACAVTIADDSAESIVLSVTGIAATDMKWSVSYRVTGTE